MVSQIPRVWELLEGFKSQCQLRGWKTSENEDWIKIDDEYHNFLWTQTVHPSTFKKIASNHKCAILKDVTYQVVDVKYTAWLFTQGPPEDLLETVKEDPELSRRTAIYNLSWIYTDKPLCLKLNETKSMAFQEFEKFLEKWGVEVKPVHKLPVQKI
jgi:hypothetical protein